MRCVWVRATSPHQIGSHVCGTLNSTRSLTEPMGKVLPRNGVLKKTSGIPIHECCHEPISLSYSATHLRGGTQRPAMDDLACTSGDTLIFDRNPARVCIGEGGGDLSATHMDTYTHMPRHIFSGRGIML